MPLSIERHCKTITVTHYYEQNGDAICDLLNNAYDAVENVQNKKIEIQLLKSSKHATVRIKDNGHGIPDEIKTKIFKPFITTKPMGKGTGLGLSIAKGIMDSHSGDLFLEKSSNDTCFTMRFLKL